MTGIVMLAAGNSSRLGRPKQLLPFGNKVLVAHVVDEALKAGLKTLVVTGSHGSEVAQALAGRNVTLVHNERWQEGMGSGISIGVAALVQKHGDLKAIITAVCDQPFVSAELFDSLVRMKQESGKGIVACAYAGTVGTPVVFDAKHFDDLQKLNGTDGAKKLLKQFAGDVATIPFGKGSVDIDTEEDYQRLQLRSKTAENMSK